MEFTEAEQSLFTNWANDLFEELEKLDKLFTREGNRVSRPKIQQIPNYMAEKLEFQRYYKPQIISLGCFHPRMSQGELYKKAWAAMYLKDTNLKLEDIYEDIYKEIYYRDMNGNAILKPTWSNLYPLNIPFDARDPIVDGCSVLQLLRKSDYLVDPEKELKISIDKLVRVHQDLLIMDNQITFQFLRLCCEDEARLEQCLHNFLHVHGIEKAPNIPRKKKENQEVKLAVDEEEEDPVHLLDYLRRALLMRDQNTFYKDINNKKIKRGSLHLRKYRIGTIRELKAAGIHVIKCSHGNFLFPDFHNGTLELPELNVDGTMAHIFLNLVAYEMCPDFPNKFEISSFLVFMSSLIEQPEDVKELRMAGIIINELASDKEVADLFNKMDTILVPETPLFAHISDQIHSHFECKRGRIKILSWMGEASSTFFRSPWTIIALLAATLGLVLTFIQTWFAVHPKGCQQVTLMTCQLRCQLGMVDAKLEWLLIFGTNSPLNPLPPYIQNVVVVPLASSSSFTFEDNQRRFALEIDIRKFVALMEENTMEEKESASFGD
ncbi:hypothetical protein PIB30_047923 [Stylosanthes scabra]|uniref:Uncharacterized protein n=1 Tax=Stylosanthes scabra TaxID=79078 RepID=A0ABU6UIT2_9FABA|nr:hypothetical protein [Stylosanthes scabra]